MLDAMQKNQITDLASDYIRMLKKHFPKVSFDENLNIHFNLHGSTWGMYSRRGSEQQLRFNSTLCAAFFDQHPEVVAHEVAHYAVDQIFGLHNRSIKPHGKEWKATMQLFGFAKARATFKQAIDDLPIRRQRRYTYQCSCKTHELSATRHQRIQKKRAIYACPICHTQLTLSTNSTS